MKRKQLEENIQRQREIVERLQRKGRNWRRAFCVLFFVVIVIGFFLFAGNEKRGTREDFCERKNYETFNSSIPGSTYTIRCCETTKLGETCKIFEYKSEEYE